MMLSVTWMVLLLNWSALLELHPLFIGMIQTFQVEQQTLRDVRVQHSHGMGVTFGITIFLVVNLVMKEQLIPGGIPHQ